jgi:predicted ATPase
LARTLYGVWAANIVAFNGEVIRELSTQFLSLAEKQGTTALLLIAQRIMGTSLLFSGEFAASRAHLERASMLYDPAQHRPLAIRFGLDIRATSLFYLSSAHWFLGYPDAALADARRALKDAREIGHAATLMVAMAATSLTRVLCGDYVRAIKLLDELATLADEKGSAQWKAFGISIQGCASAPTGEESNAVKTINSGLLAWQSTGSTLYGPVWSLHLAIAHAKLGEFDDAKRCIGEAITTVGTTKEKWWEAEINRIAGEIALMSSEPDATKAEAYFERALAVARQQQAKSWELRAAMSLARLWRDQGKPQQARELLAPVYGWFTEGLETRDLKEGRLRKWVICRIVFDIAGATRASLLVLSAHSIS